MYLCNESYFMFTTIKGNFDKGQIYLQEEVPITTKTEVMVIFLGEEKKATIKNKRIPGGLKGKVSIPDDFNNPLDDLKDYM